MPSFTRIKPMDEATLRALLEVAVREGTPEETMPPREGPPGWTEQARQAYVDFFLAQLDQMYAITADGELVGSIRLTPRGEGRAETGMWLARSWRGRGIGSAALQQLLAVAASKGYRKVIADTTPENAAAIGALLRNGAVLNQEDKIYAVISIDPAYASDLNK